MSAHRHVTLLFLVASIGMSGCYGTVRTGGRVRYAASATVTIPSEVIVTSAPPPLQPAVEVRPAPPSQNVAWIDGHYAWQGRWVWEPGHWEVERPGYVWCAPVATQDRGRIVYHPGYWCSANEAPPPVYAQPGPVRVSVRPVDRGRQPVPVTTPRGQGTVTVTTPPPRGQGTVTVTTPPPRGQGTVTATTPSGQGTVTATTPSGRGTVTATTPSGRGTVTATTPSGRGTVTATTPRGTVNQADDSVARPQPPAVTARGTGTVTATAPHPGAAVAPRPGATVSGRAPVATTNRPGTTTTGTVTVPTPGVTAPQRVLTCSIDAARAPQGGIITVSGTFTGAVRVQIGSVFGVIQNSRQGQVRVQLPGNAATGQVRVVDGGQTATCGQLQVIGR